MADVAREAGVSEMTVSYCYSRPERVAAGTAVRVREAADRLGYPGPHPGARSLRLRDAGTIGVVMGEHLAYAFDDPQAAQFLGGVADVCTAAGKGITLVPVGLGAEDVRRVQAVAVDGFVMWTTSEDDPVLDAVSRSGLPAAIQGGPARRGLVEVAADDVAAAREVARLAFRTASAPAVLSFPLDRDRRARTGRGLDPASALFPVTRRRLEGYRSAWEERGRWQDVTVAVVARNDPDEARQAARELLDGERPVDAVACMGDLLAAAVIDALGERGLRAGRDVTVTGWDDGADAAAAGLTTVRQSLRAQGEACARIALGRAPTAPVAWSVVERSSTSRT